MWCALVSTLAALVALAAAQAHFIIDTTTGNKTSFSIASFVETNVNRADDGGLYGELKAHSYLTIPGWTKVGDTVVLQQDANTPLAALKESLLVFAPANTTAGLRAGAQNSGWWGIPVLPQAYQASFWAKRSTAPLVGIVRIELASLTTGAVFASASFPASHVTQSWAQFKAVLTPTSAAPDTNNVLRLTIDYALTDQLAWFNLVSLFPPTFKGRANGMRPDLAKTLADLSPKLIRLPGGSNLQGSSIANRFNWSNTIGPLEQRPGRLGYWVGYQTEGFGLMELLDMCEDLGATAILGIYAAYSAADESVPNNNMLDKYIDDAVNQLHFVLGDASTNSWAKMRASLGHPLPYNVQHIEIGNEDYTSTTYNYRWPRFYNAIKSAYPHLTVVSTAPLPNTKFPALDLHDFGGPDGFYALFNKYDNMPRDGTQYYELENGVINTNSDNPFGTPDTRLAVPTLQATVAESVLLMGMQRNGDIVAATSYAPYFANANAFQWTPNFINFNISAISLSTSYYMHMMVQQAHADMVHPVATSTDFGPLYWVATSANGTSFFLQVANIAQTAIPLSGVFAGAAAHGAAVKGSVTALAAGPGQAYSAGNSLASPAEVVPVTSAVNATVVGKDVQFSVVVPGWSFQVYRFDV